MMSIVESDRSGEVAFEALLHFILNKTVPDAKVRSPYSTFVIVIS